MPCTLGWMRACVTVRVEDRGQLVADSSLSTVWFQGPNSGHPTWHQGLYPLHPTNHLGPQNSFSSGSQKTNLWKLLYLTNLFDSSQAESWPHLRKPALAKKELLWESTLEEYSLNTSKKKKKKKWAHPTVSGNRQSFIFSLKGEPWDRVSYELDYPQIDYVADDLELLTL